MQDEEGGRHERNPSVTSALRKISATKPMMVDAATWTEPTTMGESGERAQREGTAAPAPVEAVVAEGPQAEAPMKAGATFETEPSLSSVSVAASGVPSEAAESRPQADDAGLEKKTHE
ncbi:unnamed protein product, partial [Sphacelaria rigidula]